MLNLIIGLMIGFTTPSYASVDPDWSENATIIPGENRANIYEATPSELDQLRNDGYVHAMKYPVTVTGLLIPYRPLVNFLSSGTENPIKKLLLAMGKQMAGFQTEAEMYEWIGLSKFNSPNAQGIYKMPRPAGQSEALYVGAGIIKTAQGEGLTFSCFACHATSLFGTTVMGLTNKRPHSNKLFHMARNYVPKIPTGIFKSSTKATDGEVEMFNRTKKNIMAVDSVVPQVYGLDTSLPHTALSLARRNDDDYATKNPVLERYPRDQELATFVADSKPMPWWNLKYKTRWLADGSIVSGNPIFTNFLWNEIGRGTDLKELEKWMQDNSKAIKEITAAAFSTEAPRYTDFFPANTIDVTSAKRGEKLFNSSCLKCHGEYQKAWSGENADQLSEIELLATTKVIYHDKTPVKDVGTDPNRYQAMKYFASDLNNLAISKWMKTKVEPQVGYVPPPLVGIWARYPYFHNNSIPTLCDVLSTENNRPKKFVLGPAINKETDFDQDCVGYPIANKIPKEWLKDSEAAFDTSKPGLRNIGHTKMLLKEDGTEKFSSVDKKDMVMFLKTL
jgi:mono/diheme cytochrome c family protein